MVDVNADRIEEYKAEQARLRGCWATPDEFKDVVVPRYQLNFDAAANIDNSLFEKGYSYVNKSYITEEENALERMWCNLNGKHSRVWLNPPHKILYPWFEKAWEQINHPSGRVDIIVIMTLPSFSAKWWRHFAERADEIVDLSPRVQFVPPKGLVIEGNGKSNSRERCLVVFRREPRHPLSPARYTWHWKEEKS